MVVNILKVLSLSLLLLSVQSTAVAGMSIKPAIINFAGAPGGAYKVPIEIQNTSRTDTEFLKLYAESSEVNQAGNWEFTQKSGGKKSMLSWIRLDKSELALAPGETTSVELIVKVPRGSAGDFRVALMVDQDASKMKSTQAASGAEDLESLLQLGKGRNAPQKTTAKIIKTMRVAIPINVRIRDSRNRNWNRAVVNTSEAKIVIAEVGKGSFAINVVADNKGDYDTSLRGACSVLHAKTKAKLKVAALDDGGVTILPESRRLTQCHFEGSLPPGEYLAVVDLLEEVMGGGSPKTKQVRTPFTVSQKFSQQMQLLASPGGENSGRPHTPLMLTPSMVAQQPERSRSKPFVISVTNPTKKSLHVYTKFLNRTYGKKNSPKVKIKPKKFKLAPGKTQRIKLSVQPRGKSPAYGKLVLVTKETKGSVPATVPILIVPKTAKLVQRAELVKLNVEPDASKKNLIFSAVLVNKGNTHFDDVMVDLTLINFLGESVGTDQMKVGRSLVMPKESGKVFLQKLLSRVSDDIYTAKIVVKEGKGVLSKATLKFKLDKKSDEIISLQ
ncbi:MAG: hypothetical protein HN398_08595 [Thiotrichales bacterium]|jgi:hypothetical protein|nr:hypothetical protein [Thiotrichales bacterium]